MDYKAFEVEYQQVFDEAFSGALDDAAFAQAIDRLRGLADGLTGDARRYAAMDIAGLEDALEAGGEPMSRLESDAAAASARGSRAEGKVAERIARAEAAMDEIVRIADRATSYEEKRSILGMNEALSKLIGSLRLSGRDG